MNKINFTHKDYSNIAVINAWWLYKPENFLKQISKDTKAVLFIVFATGTFPSDVTPMIKETVDSGIPVFFLSDNQWDENGITSLKYPGQEEAINTGAIMIEKLNSWHKIEVMNAIEDAIQDWYRWIELWKIIKESFTYRVWEVIPPKERETKKWIQKIIEWTDRANNRKPDEET